MTGALVSFGLEVPHVVTAGHGVKLRWSAAGDLSDVFYRESLNPAFTAIASLNLGHEAIANLDFSNPFPVFFLAPPPKGIHVWWDWVMKLPRGAMLEWQEIIGDACVVTIPARPDASEITVRLVEMVRPKLATDFEIVHQDELWSIYRRTQDCATAPRS
jgi:hypothetical protein